MKKIVYLSLLFLLVVSCTNSNKTRKNSDKKILTVTIEPQRFFLDEIVGSDFSINVLVPPGTSPETYEPAPSVLLEMSKSDIYFKVGDLGFEKAWSDRLAQNAPHVKMVNCSDNIDLLEGQCLHHEHDHNHVHGESDPHVWSAPGAVRIFTKNILEALIATYPEDAEKFQANFNNLTERINATDSIIRTTLNQAPTNAFIIYHPALGYFAHEYGLQQHSIEFEGKSPSPAQMKKLVDLARKENINTVFVQKGFDSKNAKIVASELGAKVFEIDPLNYEWDKELIRIAQILARITDE